MHRESIYVCTYAQGTRTIVGRVRAWDGREAAQVFAAELEAEDGRRVVARDVKVKASRPAPVRHRGPGHHAP